MSLKTYMDYKHYGEQRNHKDAFSQPPTAEAEGLKETESPG